MPIFGALFRSAVWWFVDHPYRVHCRDDLLFETDADKAHNEKTAGGVHIWGI